MIQYGNAVSNAAWDRLLVSSPARVSRGVATIGDREARGEDLACLFVRPRPGSALASVGVVSGTGPAGMRLADRLPYFVSGVGYPDLVLIGADTLETGAIGVRAAGFFGPDWGLETGEVAWREGE